MSDLNKLPKWAQEHIKTLQRERDVAIRALNDAVDHQTPSPFFTDDYISTGEEGKRGGPSRKRVYFQAYHMTVESGGVSLDIYVSDDGIRLQWQGDEFSSVAFIPHSYQSANLVSKNNMR